MIHEFPPNKDAGRLFNIKKNKDVYDGHLEKWIKKEIPHLLIDEKSKRYLYISVNFASKISKYFASLILGKDGLLFNVDSDQQEKVNEIYDNNLMDIKLFQGSIDQSRYGYYFLRVFRDPISELAVIEQVPNDQISIEWTQHLSPKIKKATLYSYITMMNEDGKEEKYLYKEIYSYPNGKVEQENVIISYEAWLVNKDDKPIKKVDITVIDITLEPEVNTELEFIPIFLLNNATDSSNTFGVSDYKELIPLFKELNDRVSSVAKQLMKHMNSKMAVPQGTLTRTGDVKAAEAELFEIGQGGANPSYIVNTNPQIDQAFKHIENILRYISAIAQVPLEAFGIDQKGGVESPEGFRLRLFETIQKVSSKRLFMKQPLIDVMNTALLLEGITEEKIDLVWSDALPENLEIITKVLALQTTSGLKSQRTAVKELQNLDTEELDAELELIAEDNSVSEPSVDNVVLPSNDETTNVLI